MSQRNVPNNVLLTWQRTMIMINCFSIYRTTVKTIQTKYELLIPKGSNHLLINTNLFLFSTQDMFHIAFILLSYMYILLSTLSRPFFFGPSPTTESLEQAKLYGPQDHTKTIELSARPCFLKYCLYQIFEKTKPAVV